MKKIFLFLIISSFATNVFSGEIKNSKMAKEMEKNIRDDRDAVVNYTAGWSAKLGEWLKENLSIPQAEAEALGLNLSACYSIKNENARRNCVTSINAGVKEDPTICNRMTDVDSRYDCIASITNQESTCYYIRDDESRITCRASILQDNSMCLILRSNDSRMSCMAGIKHEKGICFSIRDDDTRWGCLAGFPP